MSRLGLKAGPLLVLPIAMAILALAPSLLASQQPAWNVVVATNAFVSHGISDQSTPAAAGTVISAGDRLTTRAGGALVLSRGEDLITMAENTQIAITDPQPVNKTMLEQPYGQAQYHVTHKQVPHFEVDTPMVATVVKGTTFTVHATATENSVSVQDGRVSTIDRRTGASASVSTGQTGTVSNASRNVSVSKTTSTAGASSTESVAGGGASDDQSDKSKGKDKDKGKNSDGGSSSGNGSSGGSNSGNGNGGSGGNGNGGSGGGGGGKGNSGNDHGKGKGRDK